MMIVQAQQNKLRLIREERECSVVRGLEQQHRYFNDNKPPRPPGCAEGVVI
jgi:hypothetical protein